MTVKIKNGLQYERRTSFENDRRAIVIKAKISRRKWVHIVAVYRQWQVLGKDSLLDLFLINIPLKVNTIKTERCQIADHSTVSLQIHAKDLWRRPKIRKTRDWRKIQPEILMEAIEGNARLNSIFAYNEPDKIANIMTEEYNGIINTLAPEKIIQVTKEDLPYFTKEILELKKKKLMQD